jgi:alginate O-acetyltransferase complex protein AlgI
VYTPLSFRFRKYKVWGIVTALMLTFLISGIWHGAAFTFIIWGLLQGTFLSIEAFTNKKRTEIEKRLKLNKRPWYILLGVFAVFAMFAFSQVFAKSENINESLMIFHKIFFSKGFPYIDWTTLSFSFAGLSILFIKDYKNEYNNKFLLFFQKSRFTRQLLYIILIYIILLMGVFDNTESFIYFKF